MADASLTTARGAILCLMNQQRDARGLPSLRDSATLDRLAQNWTQHMVATGDFEHASDFGQRFSAIGYNWQAIAENIATGFTTPRSVIEAWMASREHCRNILNPVYRDVGTGAVASPVGQAGTLPGSWTDDFGLTVSQSAPSRNYAPQNGCPY